MSKPSRNAYGAAEFAREFGVSRETLERLALYESLLLKWQKAVNLVAPSTLNDIWLRHFADSAQLLDVAPEAKIWADLGSGAGFPGLVIAILFANQDNRTVHLLESNGRKCAFLFDAVRQTRARAIVHEGRIETKGREIGAVDIVCARALAPLAGLLRLAEPLLRPPAVGLFLKGREAGEEIRQAGLLWSFQWKTRASRTDSHGQIIEIENLKGK